MKKNISRRTFLKLSGATAVTVAMASNLEKNVLFAADESKQGERKKIRTYCEMCTTRCPMEVSVKDGKVDFIAGNPEWSSTGGTLCARGAAALSQTYDQERVKKPLIRQGERGENKWKEVSWEEAYDYIAEKMTEIKEKYGPESMAFSCRGGIHKKYMDTFANAYGSPNTFTHESTCPFGRTVARDIVFGTNSVNVDYGNVKYLITLGRNLFEGINVSQARSLMNALRKGAKLISIDPRFSVTSAKATEWHPIKPGTDLAFILALTHVIIRDRLYDKAFVDTFTVGFDAIQASVETTTPEWAEKETGIAAKDIERIAKEFAAASPQAALDWGWRTGTTPEEFEFRRAAINVNLLIGNCEVPGGIFFGKNAAMINKLVGSEVVPTIKSPKLPKFPKMKQRVDGAGVKGHQNYFIPKGDGVVHYLPEAILTEKPYPIKGWFVYRNNPMISQSNTNRVRESLLKLDLLVVSDLYITDTAHFADVVLPESTFLERDEGFNDASGGAPKYTLRQKTVEPVYDTKPNWQIFKELAEKMGLGAYFPWKDIEEMRRIQMGGRKDLVEKAKEKGFLDFGVPSVYLRDPKSVAAFVKKFPAAASKVNEQGIIPSPLLSLKTPSKKMEMASSEVEELFPGREVPKYREVKLKEDDQLYFIQGKVAVHTNAHTHNVPWLNELMPENRLWMHPETAGKRGLQNGDKVEISSEFGKQPATILVSQGIRPDSAFTYFGFGRVAPEMKRAHKKGTNSNIMLPTAFAPVCAMSLHTAGIDIKKI
ncbi:thiosulfate reductase PhsA [Anaerosinus massiliensis]|uniref:thiosulfate reductase PhsA n=1 Tax=Massilibacillus massiliensis TaxID=1806837 RepID=UPI000ADD29DD|nr:thiosulfate reductase PhsA [Massilibacillus massiliensis]